MCTEGWGIAASARVSIPMLIRVGKLFENPHTCHGKQAGWVVTSRLACTTTVRILSFSIISVSEALAVSLLLAIWPGILSRRSQRNVITAQQCVGVQGERGQSCAYLTARRVKPPPVNIPSQIDRLKPPQIHAIFFPPHLRLEITTAVPWSRGTLRPT